MLFRLWLVISVLWAMFWFGAAVTVLTPADQAEMSTAIPVLMFLPAAIGLVVFFLGRFVIRGTLRRPDDSQSHT